MGSFATLYAADFDLCGSKHSVDLHVMTVFSEADKRIRWRDANSGAYVPRQEDGADVHRELDYWTLVPNACQRLDVMGFTMTRCRTEYERIRANEIASLRGSQDEAVDDLSDFHASKIDRLERLDFETFRDAFAAVMQRNVHYWDDLPPAEIETIHPMASYLLAEDHEDWPQLGFFCSDIRDFLRMALSVAPSTSELRYDLGQR